MLSYRHAFHAGNHADVLKHFVLLECLRYMTVKDKPFRYVDTHAGAGCYRLQRGFAAQNREYETGIGRLWNHDKTPEPLADYLALIRELNEDGKLRLYPGSPLIALRILREQDHAALFEMHSADAELLKTNCAGAYVRREDGFAGLKGVLPPPERRGLILIDPSYEDKSDYRTLIAALAEGLKRFATGVYLVWYPLLQRDEARALPAKLRALPADNWLDVRLQVKRAPEQGVGMYGSGVYVINPPWTLRQQIQLCLDYLVETLGEDACASGYLAANGHPDYICER